MAKNIIFLHLESISSTILWQYRAELETVWALARESRYYDRFNASATSTGMVMSYLRAGSTFIFDYKSHYRDVVPYPLPPQHLLQTYLVNSSEKYSYRHFHLDYYKFEKKTIGFRHEHNNPAEFLEDIRQYLADCREKGTPYAFLLHQDVTHMALQDAYKADAESFEDRFRRGYRSLDAMIRQVLAIVQELGLWDNTIVVGYGDHGDEFWSHDLNCGYCHATAPYASLTRTPFFIYEAGEPGQILDQLACTTDIMETIVKKAIPGFTPSKNLPPLRKAPFSGMDLSTETRELAFSQNLFALQLEHDDPEKGLTKGYSVFDGEFRLVVTSGGGDKRNGGLEFYHDRSDPFNSRSLLDFFQLDGQGNIIAFRPPPDADSPEFSLVFNERAVAHLTEKYHMLRGALHRYVREKEAAALPYSPGEPRHLMPEKAFTYARKRLHRG